MTSAGITSVPAGPRPRAGRWALFIPRAAWTPIVFTAVLTTVATYPLYADDSLWLGAAIFAMTLVSLHLFKATHQLPWLPGFVAIIAALQSVFAPWAAYHLPLAPDAMPMAIGADEYFAFAVPALLALLAGMFWPLIRLGRRAPSGRNEIPPEPTAQLTRNFDRMLIAGIAVQILVVPLAPASLLFAVTLLSYVGYSAAFALLLLRARGWQWRVGAVLLLEAFICATSGGQFLNLVMWAGQTLVLVMYVYRLRSRRVLALGAMSVVFILAINGFKGRYRIESAAQVMSAPDRARLAARRFTEVFTDPERLFSPENLAYNAARMNQGSVNSRMMYWTPAFEPFAHGGTVIEAIRSAVLPRFLDPNKYVAGGHDLYQQYTGLELINGTSIGLSIPGEMYVNFGVFGGVIGVFVYGALLGLVFRFFVERGRWNRLWWAWLPMITLSTVSAEQGLGETLNQVSKSLVVMAAVVTFLPGWQTLRRRRVRASASAPMLAQDASR